MSRTHTHSAALRAHTHARSLLHTHTHRQTDKRTNQLCITHTQALNGTYRVEQESANV